MLYFQQITNLDNKYMIQMAEARGLFGDTAKSAKSNVKTSRNKKKDVPTEDSKTRRKPTQIEVSIVEVNTKFGKTTRNLCLEESKLQISCIIGECTFPDGQNSGPNIIFNRAREEYPILRKRLRVLLEEIQRS